MLRKQAQYLFTLCKEKPRLLDYIQKKYIANINNILGELKIYFYVQDVIKKQNNCSLTISFLKNLIFLPKDYQKQLTQTCVEVLSQQKYTSFKTTQEATSLIYDFHQFHDDKDFYNPAFEFIYKYYPLFSNSEIAKIKYSYFNIHSNKMDFDQVQIPDELKPELFQKAISEVYNYKRSRDWKFQITHDDQLLTSKAILYNKRSKQRLTIYGIIKNTFEDIGIGKKMFLSNKIENLIIDLPPIQETNSSQKFDFLNKVIEQIENKERIEIKLKEKVLLDTPEDFEKLSEVVQQNKFLIEAEQIIMGHSQGLETPYTLNSLGYYFTQQNEIELNTCLLAGFEPKELIKNYLNNNEIDTIKLDLQTLKMQWLNELLHWIIQVNRKGCMQCDKDYQLLQMPHEIISSSNPIKQLKQQYLGIVNYIHSFIQIQANIVQIYMKQTKQKEYIMFMQENDLFQFIGEIIKGGFIKDSKIDGFRNKIREIQLNTEKQQYLDYFLQFYEDDIESVQSYKLFENEITNIRKYDGKVKYIPSQQLKCLSRNILF